jgi:hypothetical protein
VPKSARKPVLFQPFLSFGDVLEISIMMSAGRPIMAGSVHNHRKPHNGGHPFTRRSIVAAHGCHSAIAPLPARRRSAYQAGQVALLPRRSCNQTLGADSWCRGVIRIVKTARRLRPTASGHGFAGRRHISLPADALIGRCRRPGRRLRVRRILARCKLPADVQ